MKRFSLFVCLFFLLVLAGIPMAAASPVIKSVSPSSGPIGETVTVKITGSGYDSSSTTWIAKCGTKDNTGKYGYIFGSIKSRDENHITATFQLTGQWAVVGDYDVYVTTRTEMGNEIATDAKGFTIYKGSGSSGTTTPTTEETVVTTATTVSTGENSVFFDTDPSGATIYLSGEEIGTSAFTYHTDRDGTFSVVAKKIGYEDYEGGVTILEGQRVRFYAQLTPLSTTTNSVTPTTRTTSASSSSTPAKTVTTIRKSTVKVPTPWGTDPPVTEESPVDPALALGAAGITIGLVLFRRR